MKKFFPLLAALSALLWAAACANPLTETAAPATAAAVRALDVPVMLVQAKSQQQFHYGMESVGRTFTIKVKNLSSTKSVAIHHAQSNGVWIDIPAMFKQNAEPGFEIWVANWNWNVTMTTAYNLADDFAVSMTANGTTYWDNNGGANYKLAKHGGDLLGGNVNVYQDYGYGYRGWSESTTVSFYGAIDIRNLAYSKKVNIVWTDDGWKTVKVKPAIYQSFVGVGYNSSIPSPNAYGIEYWTWGVDCPIATFEAFEYAIAYEVNGVTYWDNNNGKNYKKADLVR